MPPRLSGAEVEPADGVGSSAVLAHVPTGVLTPEAM